MKLWKRFGAVLIAALTLTAALTGTVLAVEPAQSGISVQLNGEDLAFTDAAPEISDGRTFLPFRAVLEAMGAQVDYDTQTKTVSAQRDGVTMAMIPGQKEMTVTEDGQTRTVEMDVAPYINASSGRTYVPIRYAAETLGYAVGWDSDDRTVIIVDVDALFGDATFQLMDNFAAYCAKKPAGDNMTLSGNLNINITDQTGVNLPAPLKIGGSLDGIVGEKGAQLTGKLDLAGLSELVQAGSASSSPMELLMIQSILGSLSNLSAELRLDLDSWMLYLSLPAELTGAAQDTWYSVDLGVYQAQLLSALDMTQLTQMKDAGIRDSLVWVMENLPLDDVDTSYATLAELAGLYASMLSDQAFTQKGDAYVAQMTLEDMVDLTVTLTKQGDDIVAADIAMEGSMEEDGTKMTMTMTEHAAPAQVTANVAMRIEDADMSMSFDLDLSCVPTEETPVTVPPAGAQVVPMS